MRTLLVALVASLLAGLVLTWLVRELAKRMGMVDGPVGGRKIHRRAVPRAGGVAVAAAFAIPVAALVMFHPNDISMALQQDQALLVALLGGGLIILAVGIVDDVRGLRAIIKLLGQIAAAAFVFWAGIRIEAISIPMLGVVQLGSLSVLVTIFWFLLVTNALNLIDGMDGLAGGVTVLAAGTLLVMSLAEGNILAAVLLAALIGATAGFLVFNMNPASIFLGDTGSLFLGFVLALVSVHSTQKSYAVFSIVAAFIALGLPIFDLSMAVVRRVLTGRPMFSADQHHVHHILLRRGLNQKQSVLTLFVASAVLGGVALLFIFSDDHISALAIAAVGAALVLAVNLLGYSKIIRAGRRVMVLGSAESAAKERTRRVLALKSRLLTAETLDEAWGLLSEEAPGLGLDRLELSLEAAGAAPVRLEWGRRAAVGEDVHLQSLAEQRQPLEVGRGPRLGVIVARWYREDEIFGPHQEVVVGMVAEAMSHVLVGLDHREASVEVPAADLLATENS